MRLSQTRPTRARSNSLRPVRAGGRWWCGRVAACRRSSGRLHRQARRGRALRDCADCPEAEGCLPQSILHLWSAGRVRRERGPVARFRQPGRPAPCLGKRGRQRRGHTRRGHQGHLRRDGRRANHARRGDDPRRCACHRAGVPRGSGGRAWTWPRAKRMQPGWPTWRSRSPDEYGLSAARPALLGAGVEPAQTSSPVPRGCARAACTCSPAALGASGWCLRATWHRRCRRGWSLWTALGFPSDRRGPSCWPTASPRRTSG